jgi:hypothetical protein
MGCAVVIFVWRGYGLLAPVFPLLGVLAGYGLTALGAPRPLAVAGGLVAGSVVVWLIGRRLNRGTADPRDKHSLWGIPMEAYAVPGAILAVVLLVQWIS